MTRTRTIPITKIMFYNKASKNIILFKLKSYMYTINKLYFS